MLGRQAQREGMVQQGTQNDATKTTACTEHQHSGADACGMNHLGKLCTPLTACKVWHVTQILAVRRQELQHRLCPWCHTANQWQRDRLELSNPCPSTAQSIGQTFSILQLLNFYLRCHKKCQSQMRKSLKHMLKLTSLTCTYLNILLRSLSVNLKQEQTTNYSQR